jgi:hypothetical protein
MSGFGGSCRLSGLSTGVFGIRVTSGSSGCSPQARRVHASPGPSTFDAITTTLALFLESSVTLRERPIGHKVIAECRWALLRPHSESLLFADDLLLDADELIPPRNGKAPGLR